MEFTCHRLVVAELLEKELGVTVEHIQAVPKEALPPDKAAAPPVLAAPWELVTPPFKPPSVSVERYLRKIGASVLPGFENVEVVKRKLGL